MEDKNERRYIMEGQLRLYSGRASNKLKWCIKQLFPLTYRTHYKDRKGNKHFCVWKMWFGRCFNIDDVIYTMG